MRLSCIIPTIGRKSLTKAIQSVTSQLLSGDELLVVADGPTPAAEKQYRWAWSPLMYYMELPEKVGDYGCSPCDFGMKRAKGNFVRFMGDDDTCPPGSVEAIRAGVQTAPKKWHVFAMLYEDKILKNSLGIGKVSGQQVVIPKMEVMPSMVNTGCTPEEGELSDWFWIQKIWAALGEPVYHDAIIATLTKHNKGR